MLPGMEEPMDKFRRNEIEESVRKYYKAYNVLADLPEKIIHRLCVSAPNPNSLKDKVALDAMRAIAVVEPFLEKLSFEEEAMLMELFSTDECKRGQADRIAGDKGISRRSVFNRKHDILQKLDTWLPHNLSDEERAELFAKRWHG